MHHGIFINIDTIANQKRQLLNICMPTSFGIGSALTVVRTGGWGQLDTAANDKLFHFSPSLMMLYTCVKQLMRRDSVMMARYQSK
jgi:hypothetical protein